MQRKDPLRKHQNTLIFHVLLRKQNVMFIVKRFAGTRNEFKMAKWYSVWYIFMQYSTWLCTRSRDLIIEARPLHNLLLSNHIWRLSLVTKGCVGCGTFGLDLLCLSCRP